MKIAVLGLGNMGLPVAVNLARAGHDVTGANIVAVVGNDAGEILLIQRADSGIWLYPTGWADIGYSPAEVALKEVHEETGIVAEVRGLLGVFDGQRRAFSRIPLYSLVFHCHAVGGELEPHPLECLDVGWFARDALPEPLASCLLEVISNIRFRPSSGGDCHRTTTLDRLDAHVVDEGVGAGHEFSHGSAALFGFQVDGQRTFVAVDG